MKEQTSITLEKPDPTSYAEHQSSLLIQEIHNSELWSKIK